MTKSHGRYLESRLIALATQAARVSLENATAPPVPSLPEADASDMDFFVDQLQIVLPVLGVNAIRGRAALSPAGLPVDDLASPVFRLTHAKLGVDVRAQQIDGEFTLLAGSIVVGSWHGVGKAESTMKAYATLGSGRAGASSSAEMQDQRACAFPSCAAGAHDGQPLRRSCGAGECDGCADLRHPQARAGPNDRPEDQGGYSHRGLPATVRLRVGPAVRSCGVSAVAADRVSGGGGAGAGKRLVRLPGHPRNRGPVCRARGAAEHRRVERLKTAGRDGHPAETAPETAPYDPSVDLIEASG